MPILRSLILLFSAFIQTGTLYSASPEVEVSVGFDNLFRQGSFTPVGVTLRSPDTPLDGELILEYHAGTALEKKERYRIRRQVSLPAGFSGAYRFTLPLKVSTYPLTLRLEKNGILISRTEVALRPLVAQGPVVVVLSRRPSLDFLIPELSAINGGRIELRYPRMEFLPVNSRGWDGVSLVLWHDMSPDDLDTRSAEALAGWVASGGRLAVFDGPWNTGRDLPPPFFDRSVDQGLSAFGLGRILYLGEDLSGAGSGAVEAISREVKSMGIQAVYPSFRNSAEAAALQVSRAAFSGEESIAGPSGRLIVVPLVFSLSALAMLMVGRRIQDVSKRWLQLSALAAVALVSTLSILALPAARLPDPEIRSLSLRVTRAGGPALERREYVLFSPRGRDTEILLGPGELPLADAGVDTVLTITEEGSSLDEIDTGIWRDTRVAVESLEFPNDSLRTPGGEIWKDVVLIQPGEARLLAKEWFGNSPPPILDGTPAFLQDSTDGSPLNYINLVRRLTGASGGFPEFILARAASEDDEELRLLIYTGDFE